MEWKKVVEKNLIEIRQLFESNIDRVVQKKLKLDAKRPLPMIALERICEDLFI